MLLLSELEHAGLSPEALVVTLSVSSRQQVLREGSVIGRSCVWPNSGMSVR